MTASATPVNLHDARERDALAEGRRASRVSGRLSTARLATMLAATGAGVWALQGTAPRGTGWAAVAALGVFVALVAVHERVERRIRWHATVAGWHREARARLRRAWTDLPVPWAPDLDPHHPFAHDLDLFGPVSLFQLLGPPGTQAGRATLARWLLEPAAADVIEARQAAARELAANPELRERLAAHGRVVGDVSAFDLGVFFEWAEGERWLHARPGLVGAIAILAIATPALLVLQVMGRCGTGGGSWR